MKIEALLKRSRESEALVASHGITGMRIWNCRVGYKTGVLSYDKRNNLWQSSIKMMSGVKYCSPNGFGTKEAALEALEKVFW